MKSKLKGIITNYKYTHHFYLQLEMLLRDKIKAGGFFAIRQAFKNNDPEGKGNVTREALMHILSSTLGRLITSKQFHLLLKRQVD